MTDASQDWTARLSDATFPVVGQCSGELKSLLQKGDFKNKRLAEVLAHDPLLCARLFRAVNREQEGIIASIEQAAGLLGPTAFESIVTAGPLLEETLKGIALAAYLQSLRRAYHVAALARHLGTVQGYAHPQEFFFAGLLYSIGDVALHAADPEAAQNLAAGQKPVDVLLLPTLSRGLAKAWHLPELVHRALDEHDTDDRKAVLVRVAATLVELGSQDMHAVAQEKRIEEAGISGEQGAQYVLRDLCQCAIQTARHLLDWYPQERKASPYTPLYPGAYEWPPARKQPSAAEPRAAGPTEPSPAPAKPRVSPVQQIVEETLAAMHAKLGLKRVVFAVFSPDKKLIRGRFYRGVDKESPLRRFQFERSGASLFAKLVEKPQHVRVHAGNRDKLGRFLTQDMQTMLGMGDFVASSIFVRSKPVGLCYADMQPDRKGLDEDAYVRFKTLSNLMAKRLTESAG